MTPKMQQLNQKKSKSPDKYKNDTCITDNYPKTRTFSRLRIKERKMF